MTMIKKFNEIRPPTDLEKKKMEIWMKKRLKTAGGNKQQQHIKEKQSKEKQKQKNEWEKKPKEDNLLL